MLSVLQEIMPLCFLPPENCEWHRQETPIRKAFGSFRNAKESSLKLRALSPSQRISKEGRNEICVLKEKRN
jgi:hypothetical protein